MGKKAPQDGNLWIRDAALLHVCRRQDKDRDVQHPQSPLRLRGEVRMARGVEENKGPLCPLKSCKLREDRDAALFLHGIRVEKGILVVHPAPHSDRTGKVKDALGERRLASIDVGQDSDCGWCLHCFFLI